MIELNFFQNSANTRSFAAGEIIIRAGDTGDVMYGIQSGEVEIRVNDTVMETVGAGGIVGEMALISNAPRCATVVAKTDCTLVPVNKTLFLYLVQETPNFALRVMEVMADRLRHTNEYM